MVYVVSVQWKESINGESMTIQESWRSVEDYGNTSGTAVG